MKIVPFDGWVSRNQLCLMYPRDTNSLAVTIADATPWTWEAYTQIVASTTEDFVATHAFIGHRLTMLTATQQPVTVEYEIATGAATSEVPFASFILQSEKFISNPGASTQAIAALSQTVRIGPKLIPSGTRIAHRGRMSLADTDCNDILGVYLAGYKGGQVPPFYSPYSHRAHLTGIHSAQSKNTPSGSRLGVTESAFVSGYGAWTEVIASAASDLFITGISKSLSTVGAKHHYFEIGVGAATSEVPIGRMGLPSSTVANSNQQWFPYPLLVKKGERVAIRVKGTDTTAIEVNVNYEEI